MDSGLRGTGTRVRERVPVPVPNLDDLAPSERQTVSTYHDLAPSGTDWLIKCQ